MRHAEVERTDLLKRPEVREREILAIAAPAGFGKSTVAIQWATSTGRPVAWLTVDLSDDDPHVLIGGLLAALRLAVPESPIVLPPVWDEPFYSRLVVPGLLTGVAQLPPLTMVIDDLHLLHSEPSLALLKAVVDSLPQGSQVALVGRDLHRLPIPLWRGHGRVADLRPADLSFTEEQSGAAVRSFGHEEQASAVHQAAQGWPVAVFLLSQMGAAERFTDIEEFIETEVMGTMDAPLREFVMATAPLGSVSPALACEVAGTPRAGHFLAEAITTVLLQPTGADWFHYHPLLQQTVTAHLERENPALLARVRATAARWYLRQRHIDVAVRLALDSGDEEVMHDVVWDASRLRLLDGRTETVKSWLTGIPDDTIDRLPGLSMTAAWLSVAVGDYGNVLRHAERTLHNVQQWPYDLDRGDFGTYLALLQGSTWVGLDGPQEAEPRALAAREALGDDNPASALSALILGVNRSLLGDPRAEADLRQAVALAQAFEVPSTHVEAQSLLGLHLLATGDVSGGCDAIEQARRDYAFHDLREMRSASGILFLATVALVARRGSVADVEQALAEQARVRAQLEAVFPWYRPLSGGVLAEVSIRLGDRAGYREYLTWCEPLTTYGGLCEAWATMARREYAAASPLMGLTPAELRVWELLKSRMTLSEIADALYLSRETVKSHTGSIYRKLGVASRREAQELADTWT